MATILVYSSSEAGHIFQLVPGLTALAARGHLVLSYVAREPISGEARGMEEYYQKALSMLNSTRVRDMPSGTTTLSDSPHG